MEEKNLITSPSKQVERMLVRGVVESLFILGSMAIFGNVGLMVGLALWTFISLAGTSYLYWFYTTKVNIKEKRFEVDNENEAKLAANISVIVIAWRSSFAGKLPNLMPILMSTLIGGSVWMVSGLVYPFVILLTISVITTIFRIHSIKHISQIFIKEK